MTLRRAAGSLLAASVFVVLGAGLLVALAPAGPAAAQSAGERVVDYAVRITVRADGVLEVAEDITYDFGSAQRRGIFRDLVVRETYDDTHDRVYEIGDVRVSTNPGTPDDLATEADGNYLRIRIGDPDVFIRGVHRYRIAYTVRGGPIAFPDHDELYWDAIGNQWTVPIAQATVTVVAPATITDVTCFRGPQGATLSCDAQGTEGRTATFSQRGLGAYEGVTVAVAMPPGTIQPPPAPLLQEKWSLQRAFELTPLTGALTGALALGGVGGVAALGWRRGRDRRFTGSAVDAAFGNATGAEERVPLRQRRPGTVEFVPPDGIRPGLAGTLVDESADLLDVTATIIDLAVRGHLRIVELPREGRRGRTDYQLQRREGGKGELLGYERTLYDALFAGGPSVDLSDLKYTFLPSLAKVRDALYDDLVAAGWYRARPDRTRQRWGALAALVIVAGVALTVLAAISTRLALVPLAVVATGIALALTAGKMPARTGKGSAMASRIGGFRKLFDEGEEDTRARFAERAGIFSEYLPYAIVFGASERWAKAFEGLDVAQLGTGSWFSGPNLTSAMLVSQAIDDFGVRATGTLYASPPSSSGSSGFSGGSSGGGGGGGGGGSW